MRTPSPSSSSTRSKVTNWMIKRGPWTPEEDEILTNYIEKKGEGRWVTLPQQAGLQRCGKSCRLRWMNHLRPSLKRSRIGLDEEDLILRLHRLLGNRWSLIAGRIPGRTDNEIKNYWNTHLSKKLIRQGIDPRTHRPLISNVNPNYSQKRDHNPADHHHDPNPQTQTQTQNNYSTPAPADNSNNVVMGLQGLHDHDKNIMIGEEDTLSRFLDSFMNYDNVDEVEYQQLKADDVFPLDSLNLDFWETEYRSAADGPSGSGDEKYINYGYPFK